MAKTAKKNTRKGASKLAFRPLEDRVLVEPLEEEEITSSGIVLPDSAREKPQRGRVLAVGPGRLDRKGNRQPVPVEPGDEILFGKYAGNEVEFDGVDYKVLRADEILAVIES